MLILKCMFCPSLKMHSISESYNKSLFKSNQNQNQNVPVFFCKIYFCHKDLQSPKSSTSWVFFFILHRLSTQQCSLRPKDQEIYLKKQWESNGEKIQLLTTRETRGKIWQEATLMVCCFSNTCYFSNMYVTSFSSISYCSNLRLISNIHIQLFYILDIHVFHSLASPHSFLLQATWHKQINSHT